MIPSCPSSVSPTPWPRAIARDAPPGDSCVWRRIARAIAPGVLLAGLAVGPVPNSAADTEATADRGPIRLLLITLDTLRADRLGVYGHHAPTSPAIDGLAREAAVFADVTCSMPTTLPSHVTIFTGLTPAQHGVRKNGVVPTRELTSIFELLERRGARSAAVVSAEVLAERFLSNMGIDELFLGDGSDATAHQWPAEAVTDQGIAWLTEHGDEPFALWLHYFDPHEPYSPPPDVASRFTGDYDGPLGNTLKGKWLRSLSSENGPRLTARDRQHVLNLYDAEIASMDAQIARLFTFLKERRLWHETLIVLTADHGQAHGEHDFWGHGWRLFEPVVKVPLIVKLPRHNTTVAVPTPVQTLDILPTVTAYYGLETPPRASGRSLLPVFSGGTLGPAPPRVIGLRSGSLRGPGPLGMALHGGTWKLTVYHNDEGLNHLGRIEGEGGLDGQSFYTSDSPEVRLLKRILAVQNEQSTKAREMAPETVEMLRSLGYLGQ